MWPFKKPKPKPAVPTLKERVTDFWQWYAKNAERFYATIEDKHCSDLADEVSEAVDRWLPEMAWVFGPGPDHKGHSFTLSGEGILPKQFLAEYWLKAAPNLAGWTFYSSRQASPGTSGFTLNLKDGDEKFRPIEFWVSPYVDEQEEKIDIAVWHPGLTRIPEEMRFTALFLILDEILGEHGTQQWIGEIKFSETQLQKSMPVAELPELIADTQSKYEWKKPQPIECYTSYKLKEQSDEWLRGDIIAGTARCFPIARDYSDERGPIPHPVPDCGIHYVFVAIDMSHFPKGGEVAARGVIEDEIIDALEAQASGVSLGGATGCKNGYMDFALYDGDNSLDIVTSILRKHRVPKSTRIYPFTDDQAKEGIPIW